MLNFPFLQKSKNSITQFKLSETSIKMTGFYTTFIYKEYQKVPPGIFSSNHEIHSLLEYTDAF